MDYKNNEIFQLLVKGAVKSMNLSEAFVTPLIATILNTLSKEEREKVLQNEKER